MGSFDGAETCELIGLYILSQLQKLGINLGLYRDDGLAVSDKSPRQTENIKKKICKIFNENDLRITIKANLKSINFLDITMDLRSAQFKPYMKDSNTPLYVHKESNHPPNILTNIPESINNRLSSISSNENVFNEAKPPYQEALNKSGYNYQLKFKESPSSNTENPSGNNRKNRSRKKQITWFNPPYSRNVKTNIGKKFLNLVDKYFPKDHKLRPILNRNTVKISYSCMPNMKNIISQHNKSVEKKNEPQEPQQSNCNCMNPNQCPLDNQCLTKSIIYQATVKRKDNGKGETYIGLTANEFKTRHRNHLTSFRCEHHKTDTNLSKYVWSLKEKRIEYTIRWKIIARGKPYSPSSKTCNLCIKEKYYIICRPEMSSLNDRDELGKPCLHRKKHLLKNVKE